MRGYTIKKTYSHTKNWSRLHIHSVLEGAVPGIFRCPLNTYWSCISGKSRSFIFSYVYIWLDYYSVKVEVLVFPIVLALALEAVSRTLTGVTPISFITEFLKKVAIILS